MKDELLFLLITILSLNCYSQISFEKGYYINNADEKIDCLIKNIDWLDNPSKFEYKLTENSDKEKATIKSVKEFGIYNISKFIKTVVNIDRSMEDVNSLSYTNNPIFKEEVLFLEVLVEGEANLYGYSDGNLIRYFYNKKDNQIEQLVFKSYRNAEDKIGKNNRFKQQLWNDLKCSTFTRNKVENLEYEKDELVHFFVAYNKCNNQEYINFEEKQKKDLKGLFNLNIRPGINNSSLSIYNGFSGIDFDKELGFRVGIEAEFILPFNKNKWAIIIEPTYQYYKSEKVKTTQIVKADYKSIEFPIGIRHYYFFNKNSKIFINGSLIFDFSINSVIDFPYRKNLEVKPSPNLAFGLGYKYNDKYSLEIRYQTSREILDNYVTWSSGYKTVSIIFGYSIF